ncbi:hypothetical protein [Methylobacterium tarhaniae]|uniref:hypothetical protein n=1 Tax=Methylobacterium tarhaniae TaxID=1187852 RepID=UPI003D06D27E
MINITRIFAAAAILTIWCHVVPVRAAHIVPIERSGQAADAAPSAENCCPLRAWPYIG